MELEEDVVRFDATTDEDNASLVSQIITHTISGSSARPSLSSQTSQHLRTLRH